MDITGNELKSALNKINHKMNPDSVPDNNASIFDENEQTKVLIIDNVGFVMQ